MENINKPLSDEPDNTIILTDESGKEVKFEFLDLIEYNSSEFVVLLPEDEDDTEVVILQLADSSDPGREEYISVEDEIVLNAVFHIFKEKFRDEFNFDD